MKLGIVAGVFLAIGCSSADFEVAETNTDTGPSVDTGAIGPLEDADVDSGIESEGGVTEAGNACAVPVDPVEIWVDGASTAPTSNGTAGCPFRHVLDAVNYVNGLGGTRSIKVRNGIYNETAAIILRKGVTLSGAGVGLTQISGGGACTSSPTGYKCVVRVDGGAVLERVSIDAAPNGKHGVVTGAAEGAFPTVRSTAITGAGGSCCSGILATEGAILGPNIEASNNAYGLVIWANQPVNILAGTNKFDNNTIIGINHEGTGKLTFDGGSVSGNKEGIKLGQNFTATPPAHSIKNLTAVRNVEYGIRVTGVASAMVRNSTITGSKFGVIALHGASNYIDLGTAGSSGGNNFGGSMNRNSLAAICAMFTKSPPLDATGNAFPLCSAPKSLDDISSIAGCEDVTTYADVWYRGGTQPITAGCTAGM